MRKIVLLLLVVVCSVPIVAQDRGACIAARANVTAYDVDGDIRQLAYRDSPYYMELSGRWDQKQTDSSIMYLRTIDVEKFWRDYHVFLNVRCGKACRVWLNGKVVGYVADSRQWNEFALNAFLKYGRVNTLAIEAMRSSRESLLEADDYGFGINGEPFLLFKSDPNVSDLTLTADYDASSHEGTLTVEATIFNGKKKGKNYLEVEVWDPSGHTLDRMGGWIVFGKTSEATVTMSRSWDHIEPWTAETPKLYTVVLRLRNENLEEEELVGAKVGFRRVEVKNGLLMLNDVPLTVKGVTYGIEHTEGFSGREQLRKDIKMMKENNINAVRTAKYSPMEPYFYELCDELGLYVICDANLRPASTHQQAVATDKDFIPMFERRVDNLYGKYKNHPSVLVWSLGESLDNGVCMAAAYQRLKLLDKGRPVVFAGAGFGDNTDLIGLVHPKVQTLLQTVERATERPFVLLSAVDEDDFAQLEELWHLVESRRNLQGLFVDVWPIKGAMLSDLKKLFAPYDVCLSKTTIDDAEFVVFNRYNFSDLSDQTLEYTIFTNMRSNVSAGDLPIAIAGGGSDVVRLRIPPIELLPGEQMMVRFDLVQRGAKVGSKAYNLGTFVFELPFRNENKRLFENRSLVDDGRLVVDSTNIGLDVKRGLAISNSSGVFPRVVFNVDEARIESYGGGDVARLIASPKLSFAGHEGWQEEVVAVSYHSPDVSTVCVDAMLRYIQDGQEMCDVRVGYTFLVTGDVLVDYTLSPVGDMRGEMEPRINLELTPGADDTLLWFGLDREVVLPTSNAGILGLNRVPFAAIAGTDRQQVRWCTLWNGNNGLYFSLVNDPCRIEMEESKLTLCVEGSDSTFRLHLRGFGTDEALNYQDGIRGDGEAFFSEVLHAMELPNVKSGVPDPPRIVSEQVRFTQPMLVSIISPAKGEIRFTLDGSEPTDSSPLYTRPFQIFTTTIVKARVFQVGHMPSFTATRRFNYDYIVASTFSQKPSTPFNVGADTLLFDGEKGTIDDLSRGWAGFSGDGVVVSVNLSKPIDVDYLTLRFAHAPDLWVFAPKSISVIFSPDGEVFGDSIAVDIPFDASLADENQPRVVEFRVPVKREGVACMKIDVRSIGAVPAWHRAKGLKPWVLMDEIMVGELPK